MPSNQQGFVTGLLLVFIPPVGLICLWILLRDRRAALRAAGGATERLSSVLRATHIAPGPSRASRGPQERHWTQITDYVA